MANWSLPTLASLYSDFLTQSKERDEDAIKMLDGTTSTIFQVVQKDGMQQEINLKSGMEQLGVI